MTVTATSTAWEKDGPVRYTGRVVVQTCEYTCGALSPQFRINLFKIPDQATILDFRLYSPVTATSTTTASQCGCPFSVGVFDSDGTVLDGSAMCVTVHAQGIYSMDREPYTVSVTTCNVERWVTVGIYDVVGALSASRSLIFGANTIKAWVMYDCRDADGPSP